MADRIRDKAALEQNLEDAGLDSALAQQCIGLYEQHKIVPVLRLLTGYRASLLQALHDNQKKLDCLDYLLYQMKKESN